MSTPIASVRSVSPPSPTLTRETPARSFPASWPVYTPAHKLANWLESYAEALELNVWTSSTVLNATQDANNEWDVTVERADGTTRVLHVRHIVFAIGLGGNNPFVPEIEGREEFQGQVLHSTAHNSAKDHAGKKVFIVGSATSGEWLCFALLCFVDARSSSVRGVLTLSSRSARYRGRLCRTRRGYVTSPSRFSHRASPHPDSQMSRSISATRRTS